MITRGEEVTWGALGQVPRQVELLHSRHLHKVLRQRAGAQEDVVVEVDEAVRQPANPARHHMCIIYKYIAQERVVVGRHLCRWASMAGEENTGRCERLGNMSVCDTTASRPVSRFSHCGI